MKNKLSEAFARLINKDTRHKNIIMLFICYLSSVLIAILVYYTGGTIMVYANLMYIPIAAIASVKGKTHAAIHALFSSLLIGPFMPLDVSTNLMQGTLNWVLRTFIYVAVALVIGYYSDKNKKNIDRIIKKDNELKESQLSTIYALAKLTETRDDDTGHHVNRVSEYCRLLAEKLRQLPEYKDYMTPNFIENIYSASPLHDIGKVGIPDRILLKPGRLTEPEFETIKTHTTIGADILMDIKEKCPDNEFFKIGLEIVQSHHEKWNGTGYPYGLKESSIPLSARIMAIADTYDALRSKRVYKEQKSHQESLRIIQEESGKQFDPNIVKVFLRYEEKIEEIHRTYG